MPPHLADLLTDPRASLRTDSLLITDAVGSGLLLSSVGGAIEMSQLAANAEISIGGAAGASDWRFNGATAGRDVVWDASADRLLVLDDAEIAIGTGLDLTLEHSNGQSQITSITGDLTIRSASAAGAIVAATGTATSATEFRVEDSASALRFSVDGAGTVNVPLAGTLQHSAGFVVPCYSTAAFQAITGPGVITLTSSLTRITTTGGDAFTVAVPGVAVPVGFIKRIELLVDGGTATITVTGLPAAHDVWALDELGQSITIMALSATTWGLIATTAGDTTVDTFGGFS